MQNSQNSSHELSGLLDIIKKLRDPEKGCPWDREQTMASLGPLLVEETYEVLAATDQSREALREELGDLLSLWSLYCQIAAEERSFEAKDVIRGISEKLVRRHPHVFGDLKVSSTEEVLQNWERSKAKEAPDRRSILASVPEHLPALLRAQRVSEKCARVGFEWREFSEIKAKVVEELQEFLATSSETPEDREHQEEEFGDLLFSLVQVARRMNSSAEDLLRKATNKFIRRFKKIEELAYERGDKEGISKLSLEQMDLLWEEVKALERSAKSQNMPQA